MNRTLMACASVFVPCTFGSQVRTVAEFVHPQGQDRLLLRVVDDPLYWRLLLNVRGVREFHCLVWESKTDGTWTPVACTTRRAVRRATSACVSGIHSLDPPSGSAIVRIVQSLPTPAEALPPGAQIGFHGRFSWVAWDMRKHTLLSVLKVCRNPVEGYDD